MEEGVYSIDRKILAREHKKDANVTRYMIQLWYRTEISEYPGCQALESPQQQARGIQGTGPDNILVSGTQWAMGKDVSLANSDA